jgi:malate dehydrogenase (oxaloacetate-decarboxylating)
MSRDTPLRKNSFLQSLKEQNSVLFYQLLRRHLRELMPIVYTPTEVRARSVQYAFGLSLNTIQADAIANYSHLFRRSEGLYLTFSNQDSMEEDFLEQIKGRDLDLVVCSDAEAILGIGDQGVGVKLLNSSPRPSFDQIYILGHWGIPRLFDARIYSDDVTIQISTAKSMIYT